ncbi:MAG: hypothetical protein ACYSUM_07740 [Planctomycetota bacterium]|jgi:hypothetical protein
MRLLLVCLLASAVAAEGESRLGTLIRWYLNEEGPARREDFLEAIERLTDGDPQKVADAIRAGLHFDHAVRPVLRTGGKHPQFSLDRYRVQPIAACAGDFAALRLPENYDPKQVYPLLLELGKSDIPRPNGAIVVQIQTSKHAQARTAAWAGEALVLSLLAHLVDVVHVDPRRVFLRADRSLATLAWYIALHNPDRFAGVLAARGVWPEGAKLAPNARWFVGLAIERHQGDRPTLTFMNALKKHNRRHIHRRARATAKENHEVLMPTIQRWWKETVRPQRPESLELVSDRGTALRAFWIRMAPRAPSSRRTELGHWAHQVTARPATLTATATGNLIEVATSRVVAFDIYVEPKMFDPEKPVRVAVNGQVPESKLIHLEIGDLLEDYRDRRDTDLLYCCRLTFAVRGR